MARAWVPAAGRLWSGLAIGVLGPLLIAVALVPTRGELAGAVVGLALIVPTAVGAAVGGPVAATVAVLVGSATHNLLFTQPYMTLRVAATTDVVDLLVHTVVAVTVSLVVVREQQAARLAAARGEQAARVTALEEVDRTRTALLGAVSHDLRTPLAAIAAAASELQAVDVVLDDHDRAVMAGTIVEQAARLDRTVENLLAAGRLQSSAITLSREAVEVEDLLEEAVDGLLDPLARTRLRLRVQPGAQPVWVDPVLMVAALRNIVENALVHTPQDAPVDIEVSDIGSAVTVRVRDHGPGLDGAAPDGLFVPFRTGEGEGIGLGLAIARGFVEAHGGRIHAMDADTGGAVFELVLPAVAVPTP